MRRQHWIIAGIAIAFAAVWLTRLEGARSAPSRASAEHAPANGSGMANRHPGDGPAADAPAPRATSAADSPAADAAPGIVASGAPPLPDAMPALSPARLDSADAENIRAVLTRAIDDARRTRPLAIPPEVIEIAAAEGSVRVIFATDANADTGDLAQILDSRGRADSVADLRVFPLLGHGAARLSPGALLNLIAETATEQIELDGVQRPSLLQSVPQIGADLAQAQGEDGDGFAVAVIDTGVDGDHPMFGSRLIEEACFSVSSDCPNGEEQMLGAGAAAPCALAGCDHGTHVAGIAVGDADSGPLVGVAPHAQLIAINVFSDIDGEPGAYTSDILAAMQHVLALSAFHDIAAINLSLGGELYTSAQTCSQASPSQLSAVAQLRNAGIATVAAAGNDGFTNAISSPGCLSNVISVGSVGDSDGVSSFSNSADFLTLLAPGESIQSAAVGGGTRNASGTSMATPHVAGAIADIREAMPDATVDEIENALMLSGQPILDGRNGITTPRIRVDQAIAVLEAAGPPSEDDDANPAATQTGGGGGGGGCGLIGIEPFLVLALVRRGRGRPPR